MIDICRHENRRKNGRGRNGQQRWHCPDCGKHFADKRGLLDPMRIDQRVAEMVLQMLVEGSSIRAICRITGVDKATVLELLTLVGGRCQRYMEHELRGLIVGQVQCDEVWQFVACKEKTAQRKGYGMEKGDAWLWTAIERDTKLFVCFHLGKRGGWDAEAFIDKLARATKGRFQLSTDAYIPYVNAVSRRLTGRVDYGQVVKIFSTPPKDEARRYSPAQITRCERRSVSGQPDRGNICTSHVERSNLGLRTCLRRMTRLSLGFSKKWENHEAAVALYVCHYNYCRVHGSLKTTPAVAHGLEHQKWSMTDLLEKTSAH